MLRVERQGQERRGELTGRRARNVFAAVEPQMVQNEIFFELKTVSNV